MIIAHTIERIKYTREIHLRMYGKCRVLKPDQFVQDIKNIEISQQKFQMTVHLMKFLIKINEK